MEFTKDRETQDRPVRILAALREASREGIICLSPVIYDKENRRNPYRYLLTKEGLRFLTLAGKDLHHLTEEGADYENFAELCALLPDLAGSGYDSYVRIALDLLLGEAPAPSPETSMELWERGVEALSSSETEARFQFGTCHVPSMRTDSLFSPAGYLLRECETLADFESICEDAARGRSAVTFPLSELTGFTAPDPYHAREAYETLRRAYTNAEGREKYREALPAAHRYHSSQVFRIVAGVCKAEGTPLILTGKCPPADLTSAITYLKRCNRLPRILLGVSDPEEVRSAVEARIFSEVEAVVPIARSMVSCLALRELLRELMLHYPLGKLCYLVLRDRGEYAVTHLGLQVGYERFLRVLSRLLADMTESGDLENEAAAILLGKKILFENADAVFAVPV